MASKTLNVTLLLRNDPAATWASENPVLAKGEIGIENDTKKFKFGDGVMAWNSLQYASSENVKIKTDNPTGTDINYDIGTIWMNSSNSKLFILFAKNDIALWGEIATVNSTVTKADKLATACDITMSGDITTETKSFDGSEDVSFNIALKTSGVTAGSYTKVTVNNKGLITGAENLAATDIPSLTLSKISNAGTVASKNYGISAGQIPILDSDGKLDPSVIHSLAITDTFEVSSEAAMLALTDAETGDVAIRSDENKCYILGGTGVPSFLTNWKLLRTPTNTVLSVNGNTGAVTLTTSNISEGSNLYFTEARATANFDVNFALNSSAGLTDGNNILRDNDTFTFNGGNA